MSGAVFTLGNSVSGSLSLGSALSKFGRVAGQAGFTIEQDEETLNNTVTSRYAGLAAVTVSGVTSVLNPSLVLIPSAYNTSGSTGILYSLHSKPNGVADFVVTRATEGTRFNSVGRISTVGSGDARLDYYTSGGTAGTPALLVEPAATNFADSVQYLSRAEIPAASGGLTITTGSTDFLAPDGTSGSITKYVGGAASGVSQYALYTIGNDIAVTASGLYTLSMFVRAAATNPLNFIGLAYNGFSDSSGTTLSYFSLASGTALTAGASIQNYGNGWYRLILPPLTVASTDLTGSTVLYFADGNGDANWAASGALNLTVYAWGLQMEAGSVATSYIPTTTAAVTRNADLISLSGAVSGCIGQTQGTIYAEFRYLGNPIVRASFVYLRQAGFRGLSISFAPSDSPSGISFISRNTSGTTSIQLTNGLTLGAYYKIAIAYDAGGTAAGGTQASGVTAYVNGSPATVSVGGLRVPDANLNELRLYGANSGEENETPNGNIRSVALYTTKLSNAELAALTTL